MIQQDALPGLNLPSRVYVPAETLKQGTVKGHFELKQPDWYEDEEASEDFNPYPDALCFQDLVDGGADALVYEVPVRLSTLQYVNHEIGLRFGFEFKPQDPLAEAQPFIEFDPKMLLPLVERELVRKLEFLNRRITAITPAVNAGEVLDATNVTKINSQLMLLRERLADQLTRLEETA